MGNSLYMNLHFLQQYVFNVYIVVTFMFVCVDRFSLNNVCELGWCNAFFVPGPDCIRIPYGTKLSLYMSKDSEGTERMPAFACVYHNVSLTPTHPLQ